MAAAVRLSVGVWVTMRPLLQMEGGFLANEKNLIPGTLTAEEASKLGRLGGIASGEARRQRRRMREYAEMVLDLPVKNKSKQNKLSRMGIEQEAIDNEMLMIVALIEKAQGGDVAAAREIRSIIGEDANLPPSTGGEDDGLWEAIAKAVVQREV